MATENTLRDVPADRVAAIVDRFRAIGASVQKFEQADGRFTVVATFQGSPHSTPFATADEAEILAPLEESADAPLPPINRSTAFNDIDQEYRLYYDRCRPNQEKAIDARVDHLLDNAPRYRALGQSLNVPWAFIGIIHSLESNFSFVSHLHNGDTLTQRTTHVPAGRPAQGMAPFTWEQSAEDALRLKGYVGQTDWSIARMLFRWESFNGHGYRSRGIASPYLWSFSQHYVKGLFVSDHVFDPEKISRQCGAAVLLKVLQSRI